MPSTVAIIARVVAALAALDLFRRGFGESRRTNFIGAGVDGVILGLASGAEDPEGVLEALVFAALLGAAAPFAVWGVTSNRSRRDAATSRVEPPDRTNRVLATILAVGTVLTTALGFGTSVSWALVGGGTRGASLVSTVVVGVITIATGVALHLRWSRRMRQSAEPNDHVE